MGICSMCPMVWSIKLRGGRDPATMIPRSDPRMLLVCCLGLILLSLSSADPEICEVTKDPSIKYFDIRLQETDVPDTLTTYACQKLRIPLSMDQTYHAVAFEPIIANKDIMHHMILFGCYDENEDPEPHVCSNADNVCRTFLVQWSMGIEGQICSHPDAGVRFGKGSLKSMHLQIHWNNHHLAKGLMDSSGVRVFYTTHLRKYDEGNLQVGQNDLQIPPGVAHFQQSGSCSGDCTRQWLQVPIYLTRAHVHMHYTGDGGILEVYRNGQKVRTVVEDLVYDYNKPPAHYVEDPAEVLPGDEIRMTCYFNTRDGAKKRNRTLYWGEGSDGEMCYAFITYHPKVDHFDQCIQFDVYDICTPDGSAVMNDCVFEGFTHYFQTTLAGEILNKCGGGSVTGADVNQGSDHKLTPDVLCSDACDEAISAVTDHPCMQDRLGHNVRRVYLPWVESWNEVKVILDAAARYCLD